jgi:hypothetical protein
MQWNPQTNTSPAMNVLCPPPFNPSPSYPTYSFTADFRSPSNNIGSENGTSNSNLTTILPHNSMEEGPLIEPVKHSLSPPLPSIEHKASFLYHNSSSSNNNNNNTSCYASPKSSPQSSYEVSWLII